MASSLKREGFRGQIIHFSPEPLRREVSRHPLGVGLHLVHAGWFPTAEGHYLERLKGISESIMIYCAAGSGWFETDGIRQRLEARQALFIPLRKPHSYGANPENPWSIYWVHFSGTATASYSALLDRNKYVVPIGRPEAEALPILFRQVFQQLSRGFSVRTLLFASHVLRHILGLILLHGTIARRSSVPSSSFDALSVIEFLRANVTRSLSLAEISKNAGLSPSRLSALFRERTGLSPVEHHIGLRMQAACHLLDTRAMSVKGVAVELGYDDPYYFSRCFRRVLGLSPTEYRKSVKG
ncbi:MAG: helix-turn-helix domain-containing protein [Terrimicrobiaceae bacterium]|jgi:AraC-like DNA-binding protein